MSKPSSDNQILARLDAYLPALNTGLMDGKIQDVIIKHPLVRSLVVPECDLEARRRCIALISKALEAATPVLPLILQDHQTRQDRLKLNGNNNDITSGDVRIPRLSLDAQSRLITIVASMAERDPLIKFWMNHHIHSHDNNQSSTNDTTTGSNPSKKRKYSSSSGSGTNKYLNMSTFDLYLKVKTSKEILADLADRIQGAVCKAFWDCWDEIFITLAEIIGAEHLQKADEGRIFRPCGDAAIYLNNLKVIKKRQVEQKKRLSMLEGQKNQPISTALASAISPSLSSVLDTDQFLVDIPQNFSFSSPSHPPPLSPDKNVNNNNGNNGPTIGGGIGGGVGGSPDSLSTTDSTLSQSLAMAAGVSSGPTPPSHNASVSAGTWSGLVDSTTKFPLVDSNDLEFIMQDIYPPNATDRPKFDQYLGVFTNLDDSEFPAPPAPQLQPSRNNSQHSNRITNSSASDASTPYTSASPTGSIVSGMSPASHLNLRQRIKLMEEGKMPEERPSPSNIVW